MTVLLIRPNRNEADQEALALLGIDSVIDPYLHIEKVENPEGALLLLHTLRDSPTGWLIVSSANALSYWLAQLPPGSFEAVVASHPTLRYAAIGEQTAQVLRDSGINQVLIPDTKNARSLAELLVETEPCTVVIPSGSLSMRSLPDTLKPAGFTVVEEVFYHTEPVSTRPRTAGNLRALGIDCVVLRSPSAAQAFLAFNPDQEPGVSLVCGGLTTAGRLRSLGVEPNLVCTDPNPVAIAQEISDHLGKQ
jgi:uroporphyrinogen-III synthase